VHEKEQFGIKAGEHADDAVLNRFRAWALDQKLTISDKDWEANLSAIQEQLSIEMANVAFGIEAGFKILCEKDPAILKALEIMPEAESLVQKKQLLRQGAPKMVAATL
jgi:carboxyl-terminal processing protease